MLDHIIKFFLENKLVTFLLMVMMIGWGIMIAPFNWNTGLPKDSVPVDAIPDIGENQQIVFTEWPGRSPQDIEDQITYPLTSSLLGIPGVKTIRSSSVFGFSTIYLIFEESVAFYWSRSRILEKLNSLPKGLLPNEVQPTLGPDATALGQVFWYTIEGRDKNGKPTGGWDPQGIRSVQDYFVRYALAATEGVSEVASAGGFVKEYQIDIDPAAMQGYGVTLTQVIRAIRESNQDIGAKTLEINQVEYLIRGLGYVKSLEDLGNAVVKVTDNVPVKVEDIAKVSLGPASRRGVLDKSGAEAVGGVVVARYGANPLEVIDQVKAKIKEISSSLPSKTLADGTVSQLTIVPFYDRTQLIRETIGTLEEALTLEVFITVLVVMVMLLNLRASILISSLLPIAVLMCFIAMRYFGVDANIVALSGIAIAIGTMVDVGIVLTENISRHLQGGNGKPTKDRVYEGAREVAPAIITAVMTTVVSFIPVFAMEAAEGKLFRPLAYTKTFALLAAIIVALVIIPAMAHLFFGFKPKSSKFKLALNAGIGLVGIWGLVIGHYWAGLALLAFGLVHLIKYAVPSFSNYLKYADIIIALLVVTYLLSREWLPLGVNNSAFVNFIFVALIIGLTLGVFIGFIRIYPVLLHWCLQNRVKFLIIPSFIILLGTTIWIGFDQVFGFVPNTLGSTIRSGKAWGKMVRAFPGIGKEFMPALDEGAFLLMPTSMPHAGVSENKRVLQQLDRAVTAIPEVEIVVGKLGRVESALDPAPISMYENLIQYKSEYRTDENGRRLRFKTDDNGGFLQDEQGNLIKDTKGKYFRQWRDKIQSPDDIWDEIVQVTQFPGVTSAPKLQPIETRLVMLQTGMRAPMGIKVKGTGLEDIEAFGLALEKILKEIPSIKPEAVFAERIVGKPYLLVNLDRGKIARYGLSIGEVQNHLQVAIGGMPLTTTVEGRERYPVRVRYPRELRDSPQALQNVLVPVNQGLQVPLFELATIEYTKGPQMIKSEDTFLTGYVIFDKKEGFSEVEVVNTADQYIRDKVANGQLTLPPGVTYEFAGNYQNQLRAEKRLSLLIPLVLVTIFLILYFQFRSVPVTLMVFSGIAVAFGGGFLMLWLYGQEGFLNFSIFGTNMRSLFQIENINLSVAVWVGFIALFGIATDDGVLMATYLNQSFARKTIRSKADIRKYVMKAGKKRVKPCLMTTATTLLALLPILTSTGKGADVMIPMAIPSFGGMLIALITLFVVPVLYATYKEFELKRS